MRCRAFSQSVRKAAAKGVWALTKRNLCADNTRASLALFDSPAQIETNGSPATRDLSFTGSGSGSFAAGNQPLTCVNT